MENYIGKINRMGNKKIFIHFKHVSLKDNENNSILSPMYKQWRCPSTSSSNDDVDIGVVEWVYIGKNQY